MDKYNDLDVALPSSILRQQPLGGWQAILLCADFIAIAASGEFLCHAFGDAVDMGEAKSAIALAALLASLGSSQLRPGWRLSACAAIVVSSCMGFASIISAICLGSGSQTMRANWVVYWCATTILWFILTRLIAARPMGWPTWEPRERVALVGAEDLTSALAKQLTRRANVIAVLGEDSLKRYAPAGRALANMAWTGEIDTVLVARHDTSEQNETQAFGELLWLPTEVTTPARNPRSSRRHRSIGGIPLEVVQPRVFSPWAYLMKNALDLGVGILLAIVLIPVQLAIAALILTDQPGAPILFRQERVGWTGRRFTVLKFRTMYPAACGNQSQTSRCDERVTPIGRFLRRSSLDELPQLWNVVVGDMSLVGPRPMSPALHEAQVADWHLFAEFAARHRVKPGLTGWAQINGSRGPVNTHDEIRKRLSLDLFYIQNWSIWLDIQILLRTPRAVLRAEGAF